MAILVKILLTLSLFAVPFFADAAGLAKPANNLGLVGYWSFNEGTSTTAGDFSGNNATGTISGSTWITGKLGKAIQFPGSTLTDYVMTNPYAMPTSAVSVAFWVKTNGSGDGLISYAVTGTDNEFLIYDQSNITIYINASPVTTGIVINDNNWHYIVLTWQASDGAYVLYKDGANVYSGSIATGVLTTGGAFVLAQEQDSVGGTFDAAQAMPGNMDEVRIYNRVFTAAQVLALYNSGAAQFGSSRTLANGSTLTNGLAGHWTFDGGDVTDKVYDRAGGNSGYIGSGGPATSTMKVQGKLGQALNFNGSDNLLIPYSSTLAPTAAISFGAWFKTTSSVYQTVFSKTDTGGYNISINRSGSGGNSTCGATSYLCSPINIASSYTFLNYSTAPLQANTWYFAMTTYDGSTARLYLNGVQVASASVSGSLTYSTNNPFCIGNEANVTTCAGDAGNDSPFLGNIDDVRIYTRALSAAEVLQLYNLGGTKAQASGATLTNGTTLQSGLAGYWSFNGADLTDKVYDRSGNDNNGYIYNAATTTIKVAGKMGQALNFDGVDDDVLIPSSSTLNPGTNSFTVAAWIKEDTYTSGNAILLKTNGGGASSSYGWHWGVFNSNQVTLHFATAGSSHTKIQGATSLSTGVWYHVAVVVDRSNINNSKVYVNGVADSTTVTDDGTNTGSVTNTVPVAIGSESDNGFNFDGQIDEARLYTRALTSAEVLQLYNLGK